MNIQWTKQSRYTSLKVDFKNFFFFFSFFFFLLHLQKNNCLNFFKLTYFWISRPNSSVEGDGVGIFTNNSNRKLFFLLKIKIKQSQGCPNKDYNTIFKHIHKNIRTYSRSKKNWSMIEKRFHIAKNPRRVHSLWRTSFSCSKFSW